MPPRRSCRRRTSRPRSPCSARCSSPRRRSGPSRRSSTRPTLPRVARDDLSRDLGLWSKGEPVDAITLANELRSGASSSRSAEPASPSSRRVPAAANVDYYAQIVKESATLRALIQAGQEITRLGRERIGEPSSSTAPSRSSSTSPRSGSGGLRAHRPAHRELRAHYEALRGGRTSPACRADSATRPAHLRPPAGEPRDPRGEAVDGGVGACALHRREPRRRSSIPVALFTLEMSKSR